MVTAYRNGTKARQVTDVTFNQNVTTHGFVCSTIPGRNVVDDVTITVI